MACLPRHFAFEALELLAVGLGPAPFGDFGEVLGLVAASGTGCQQVLALLDHAGVGVTHALGVGGRDLSAEVGGLATREALRRLDADSDVELVVLVSKPPAEEAAAQVRDYAAGLGTPVELALLGPGHADLTQATEAVLRRMGREVPDWPPLYATLTNHDLDDEAWFVHGDSAPETRGGPRPSAAEKRRPADASFHRRCRRSSARDVPSPRCPQTDGASGLVP